MLVEEIQAPQRWEPSDLHSPPACVACLAEDWEAVRPRTAGRHLHLCFGTVGPSPAICDPAGLALPIGLPLTPTTQGLAVRGGRKCTLQLEGHLLVVATVTGD